MRKSVIVATISLVALLSTQARAAFPDKDIRIICGFAAGGTCDLVARLIAKAVAPEFKQNVIVENRTGAGGTIAMASVARSEADGHTVLLCSQGQFAILPELPGMKLPVDPAKDLVPVANMTLANFVMVVPASRSWKTVADFVAAAKTGKLSYASAGNGTLQHIAGEAFRLAAGVEMTHVPYRGASPAGVDLIAGRVDTLITNLADVVGQIEGGQMRLLAFTDPYGSPKFPDAPKMSQTFADFAMGGWFGICGPSGMPADAIARWHSALKRAGDDPAIRKILDENGLVLTVEDAKAFGGRMAKDRETLGRVIRDASIRSDN
ncbi:tripartite tricarboxylate transporter family receptor [Variibacter gotjawalensis]|uniref:Tripartite tricarboxylate transporter family receptor n=1 Tax=Variibacter gotjawalensis TaxID=1333996 RepID=A0A0S3PPA4_9BRAD|nr:tripartite tricarboxylate transporter substrate binding protein [Variibacter gotjawalensis]NIK48081.1 tripartite-type tricarboxylate transporter receptor subunit TctC [Variibacter gotjawalensis]RZS49957.1 tripartite-type tricarboxylate transporter receptor subunit TctC [Variibacter gotjawalensis]BAT57784.1 tripartite tricarboxylate transporter family receptor [Variibacter gotjawalensis]